MFVKFLKILCVGIWLAGFGLLGMSYMTTSETERLYAGTRYDQFGNKIPGLDPDTGRKNAAVIQSEQLARWQMLGGISAIVVGALAGLAATVWGQRGRRRDYSRVGSNPDHLATQFRRRRHPS